MAAAIKVGHVCTVDMSLRYLLLNQLLSLKGSGYDVVGISSSGPDVPLVVSAGLRHIDVRITRNFSPLADLGSLASLVHVMRRERFTIVHTHNPKPGLLGQLAARLAAAPIVINTLHGFYFHEHMPPRSRRFYILMEKLAARFSDVILSQNGEDIETAVKEGICPPEKIKPLGNGIDVSRFDRQTIDPTGIARTRRDLNLPEDVRVVGFVGRLVAEKGIHEFLEAARVVLDRVPRTRFVIVGPVDHEKKDALSPHIAKDYGVSEACVFTGIRQDMPELYAVMDVFVFPSHREGFPRAPMEASAVGVPCIATNIRGCRQVVEDGRNGLLVPLRDPVALAEAITHLLLDTDEARQMGREGRRLALERFDEQQVFNRVKYEYARLLAEKGISLPACEQAVS